MNILLLVGYFVFIHSILLIPSFGALTRLGLSKNNPTLQLSFTYFLSITTLGLFGILLYGLDVPEALVRTSLVLLVIVGTFYFFRQKAWKDLAKNRLILLLFFITSLIPTVVISIGVAQSTPKFYPDPEFIKQNNYQVLNVKVLNFAHTPANDNYIPYRQAQFFINNSDPKKDSFISEWGVSFFQRTVLMGSVVSSIFTMLNDKPPIHYLWGSGITDPDHTYQKFQIIAHILNSVLIIPAFLLVSRLFSKKTAALVAIFIASSSFYMYNSIFSWPKSLTAFFILLSIYLLLGKGRKNIILSGLVSGVAYLTHDLAIVFIATSVVFLIIKKRFKDTLIYLTMALPFPVIWAFISSVVYKRTSTFFLYPFSLDGLPQGTGGRALIRNFLNTSPLKIIQIKINGLIFLMSPYQLFTSDGGKDVSTRLWALGIYSVPGSLGLGPLLLAPYSLYKHFKKIPWEAWFFSLFPVLIILLLFGNPKVLGSLHFSEPILVLILGMIIYTTLSVKRFSKQLILSALVINIAYTIFFVAYSFDFRMGDWLHNLSDVLKLIFLSGIFSFLFVLAAKIQSRSNPWFAEEVR